MKYYLFFAAALLTASSAIAQQTPGIGLNRAYLEIGGMGGQYSFNYERRIPVTKAFSFSAGVSLAPSLWPPDHIPNRIDFVPRIGLQGRINYNIGGHEIGLGYGITMYTYKYSSLANASLGWHSTSFLQIGYGYNFKSGMYLGGYFTPAIKDRNDLGIRPPLAIRIGYTFGHRNRK